MSVSSLNNNSALRAIESSIKLAKTPAPSTSSSSSARPAATQASAPKPMDSFDATGRTGARPSGSSPAAADAFKQIVSQVATQAATQAVKNLLTGLEGKSPQNSTQGAPDSKPVPMTKDGRVIPQATDKRPPGDNRSAAQIVKDSPVLANLGRQKDIEFDNLCKQTGVDSKIPLTSSKQNPDAVYRLSKVLEYIDASPECNGDGRPEVKNGKGDGNIEGITSDGDARHGTEAGMDKDFAEQGYKLLNAQQTLPTTSDTHVNADGSNKDNFQWGCGQAAKALFFIPGISNVLAGIGNSKGGVGGAIEGALGGAVHTVTDGVKGVFDSLKSGKINPIMMGLEAYKSELAGGTETPGIVKDIAGMLP